MEIKRYDGTTIIQLDNIPQGSILHREIGGDDYVKISFCLSTIVYMQIGDYVQIDGFGRYELNSPYTPKYNSSTGGYDYTLQLDAHYKKWANKICRYIPTDSASETSFNLTASILTHLAVVQRNLDQLGIKDSRFKYNGIDNFILDTFGFDTEAMNTHKYISYDSLDIITALNQIANTFECEWWVQDKFVHFGKYEFGDEVELVKDVAIADISDSEGSKEYATRLIAFGSDRNLPSNYRQNTADVVVNGIVQKRLMLPLDKCPNGYVGESNETLAVETVYVDDEVYPKTECYAKSVTTYTDTTTDENENEITQTFYRITDGSGFTFNTSMILEGETLHILFTSGLLNGMDFECHYDDEGQYYEVVVNDTYGRDLPDDVLHPVGQSGDYEGDKFVIYGWDATKLESTNLIEQAENALYDSAMKKLEELSRDPNTYTCEMRSDWVQKNNVTFNIGQKVKLIDPSRFPNGRSSRIIGYEYNLDIPYDKPKYIVGESLAYSYKADIQSQINNIVVNGVSYSGSGSGNGVYLITQYDSTSASDYNTYSALRAQKEFLSKTKDEETAFSLKVKNLTADGDVSAKGKVSGAKGEFTEGRIGTLRGEGMTYDNGVFDTLTVTKRAHFFELIVDKVRSAGGALILSPADGFVVDKVLNEDPYNGIPRNYVKGKPELNVTNANRSISYQVSDDFLPLLKAGVKVTFSAYVEVVNVPDNVHYGADMCFRYTDGTTVWNNFTKSGALKGTTADGYRNLPAGYYSITVTLAKDVTSLETLNMFVNGVAEKFVFKDFKIEIGDTATAWCPAEEDKVPFDCRLMWKATDGERGRENKWRQGDQAICQTFNAATGTTLGASNKFYWVLVSHAGTTTEEEDGEDVLYNYIDLDTSVMADGSTLLPEVGDEIAMLGYRGTDDPERQSAIYVAAYNSIDKELKAPLFAEYRGINDFNLSSHIYTAFAANKNIVRGDFINESTGTQLRSVVSVTTSYAITATATQPTEFPYETYTQAYTTASNGWYVWEKRVSTWSDGDETSEYFMWYKSKDGKSLNILGVVDVLPQTGNVGDIYMKDGHLWIWTIAGGNPGWEDLGDLKGEKGDDGKDSHVHFAWANSADGQTDFTKTKQSGVTYDYIGVCTNNNASDTGLTYSDYTWTKIKGEDGESAVRYWLTANYTTYTDAMNAATTVYQNAVVTVWMQSGAEAPQNVTNSLGAHGLSVKWSRDGGTAVSGVNAPWRNGSQWSTLKFVLYMGGSEIYSVTIPWVKDGENGRGIASQTYSYAIGDDAVTTPTAWPYTDFSTAYNAAAKGKYVWTRELTTYTDNSEPMTRYTVVYKAKDGDGKGIQSVVTWYKSWNDTAQHPTAEEAMADNHLSYEAAYAARNTGTDVCIWVYQQTTYTDGTKTEAWWCVEFGGKGSDAWTVSLSPDHVVFTTDEDGNVKYGSQALGTDNTAKIYPVVKHGDKTVTDITNLSCTLTNCSGGAFGNSYVYVSGVDGSDKYLTTDLASGGTQELEIPCSEGSVTISGTATDGSESYGFSATFTFSVDIQMYASVFSNTRESLNSVKTRVSSVEGTVSQHGSQIRQNASDILLKASQSDLDDLSEQVASIDVSPEAITAQVSSAVKGNLLADGAFTLGLDIPGTRWLPNGKNSAVIKNDTNHHDGYNYVEIGGSGSQYDRVLWNNISLTQGKKYTLSFWYQVLPGDVLADVEHSVDSVDGATYEFVETADGYYESNNKGEANSYAICCVTITTTQRGKIAFGCINYAESSYDYGYLSTLQTTQTCPFSLSNTADTTNIQHNFKTEHSANEVVVEYPEMDAGTYYVYVKYRKDGSDDKYNDSLKFKVGMVSQPSPWLEGFYEGEYGNEVNRNYSISFNGQPSGEEQVWTKCESKITATKTTSTAEMAIMMASAGGKMRVSEAMLNEGDKALPFVQAAPNAANYVESVIKQTAENIMLSVIGRLHTAGITITEDGVQLIGGKVSYVSDVGQRYAEFTQSGDLVWYNSADEPVLNLGPRGIGQFMENAETAHFEPVGGLVCRTVSTMTEIKIANLFDGIGYTSVTVYKYVALRNANGELMDASDVSIDGAYYNSDSKNSSGKPVGVKVSLGTYLARDTSIPSTSNSWEYDILKIGSDGKGAVVGRVVIGRVQQLVGTWSYNATLTMTGSESVHSLTTFTIPERVTA